MKYKTIFSNIIKIIFAFIFFNLIFINVIHAQVPTIIAEGPIISKTGIFGSITFCMGKN